MNKYLSDIYYIEENCRCLKQSQLLDYSFPISSSEFNKSFLDIFPALNPGLSLDEEKDENNFKYLFNFVNKNQNCKLEYEGDLRPLFIVKIENEEEKILPQYFKLDSCIKHFKVSITQYVVEVLNLNLNNSNCKDQFQIPSSKKFTANTNYVDNFDFLFMKIKDILVIGLKNEEAQAENNNELIKLIYEDKSDKYEAVKNILELNYENIIQAFYNDTKIFNKFKQSKLTQFYNDENRGFPKQFKFSLLENYGFLDFIKNKSFPRNNKDKVLLEKKRERLSNK